MKSRRHPISTAVRTFQMFSVAAVMLMFACEKKPDDEGSDDSARIRRTEEGRNNAGAVAAVLPSLQASLDIAKARSAESLPPEKLRAFQDGIDRLRESGIVGRALKVGDKAVDFDLPNATGERVRLSALLDKGPVVIAWYRGGWCPYCSIQLAALQRSLPEIRKYGATLVGISPELPDNSLTTVEKHNLEFEVLSDRDNLVARKYRLVYRLSDELVRHLNEFVDLEKYYGNVTNELPVPATYVVDKEGVIRFAFVDADYRKRAEPSDVVAALKKLSGRP